MTLPTRRFQTCALLAAALCTAPFTFADQRPNILLVVADDLGYSDIGAFGSEIRTPTIDSLASSGAVLRDFHTAPSCSPTRAALLTGNDQHLSGLGLMAEVRKRRFGTQPVLPGYEGVLDENAVTLPQLLSDAGYKTIISGKWHLGRAPELQPQNRGFEESYVVLEGGSANYRQNEMGLFPNYPATFLHNGKPVELPADFNATVNYTDHLIESIDAARRENKPFFAFAAYTAPHWPLQAPDRYLQQTRGRYDAGYQAIASKRVERMHAMGLLSEEEAASASVDAPNWSGMSTQARQHAARKMEIYAAMVEQLDDQVARLVEHLKKTGQYDNTLIVFMSDNGPESKDYDGRLAEWVNANFDNSLANMGRVNSFVAYGKYWAAVSATPLRGAKQSVLEGGTRVPAIVSLPGGIAPGERSELLNVRDLMPTILEFAKVPVPGIEYAGRPVHPLQGESFAALLRDTKATTLNGDRSVVGWEVDGSAALRLGSMKLVYPAGKLGDAWQLFDLARDKGERHDLAGQQPQRVETMKAHWRHYAQVNNIALNPDLSPAEPLLKKN